MMRLLIDDKEGNIHALPHGKIQLKHSIEGKVGSMEFQYFSQNEYKIKNGQVVRLEMDEEVIFYGYVFKVTKDKITCYDQLRYLKYKDSKYFDNKKASEILSIIANENNIKTGTIEDTKYVIPKQISDEKEWLDMIVEALQATLLDSGRLYFLQDRAGSLELLDIENTKLGIIIDGESTLSDYTFTKDIDTDTFNLVKLVRQNEDIEKRKEFIYQDSNNIGKWGKLQYHEIVDEKLNDAQIHKKGENLLELKNREKMSFSLKNVIGDIRCRAGYSVFISIPEEGINGWYLIKSDTHRILDNEYLMDLELVIY